ncbi:MAG: PAS domain S-box protein [Nitrospirae bacterium]|nr:PAS domain S-box protein [Nitrospirota bacterium]
MTKTTEAPISENIQAKRILVVEDEYVTAKDIKSSLLAIGYEVLAIAASGEEAIAKAAELRPDLILMDIKLHGPITGVEAAYEIRKSHDIPIVFVTANVDVNNIAKAKTTEPFGFLTKPCSQDSLRSTIDVALYRHEADVRRKCAEKEVRREKEKWELTFNAMDDLLMIVNHEYKITKINRTMLKMLNKTSSETIGKNCFKVLHDSDSPPEYCFYSRLLSTGQAQTGELNLYGRCYAMTVSPIYDELGSLTGAIHSAKDITDRKKIEEKLHRSEENLNRAQAVAQIGSWFLNIPENLLEWSDETYRMFDIPKQEAIDLNTFVAVIHPDDREKVLAAWDAAMNGAPYDIEHRTLVSGKIIWVRERATIERDKEGKPLYGIGTVQDITKRKLMDDELKGKNELLEQMNKELKEAALKEYSHRLEKEELLVQQSKMAAMGEMIGAIAHQWRQPLNVLGLIVQSMEDAYEHGELNKQLVDKTVDETMKQIRFMSKTIDDFRNFMNPSKEKQIFDLKMAAGEILSLLSVQMKNSSISYALTCHTHQKTFRNFAEIVSCGECETMSYQNEFKQVILNLLTNSKDAILDRRSKDLIQEGAITIDFYSSDKKIVIELSDNGGGISEEHISKIFDPHFTTKEKDKGSGMGLYMSKVIIEKNMGGKISAVNIEGGVKFIIELSRR